jgi:hypothetical protein
VKTQGPKDGGRKAREGDSTTPAGVRMTGATRQGTQQPLEAEDRKEMDCPQKPPEEHSLADLLHTSASRTMRPHTHMLSGPSCGLLQQQEVSYFPPGSARGRPPTFLQAGSQGGAAGRLPQGLALQTPSPACMVQEGGLMRTLSTVGCPWQPPFVSTRQIVSTIQE